MRRRLLRNVSSFMGWVIGITGCGESMVMPEYGMPHADFDMDGKVVRAGTTNGIPGIEIRFAHGAVLSDGNGKWAISVDGALACGMECELIAADIDGEANGTYQDKTIEFSTTQVSIGNGFWYQGMWVAHDLNVEMEPTEGGTQE